MSTDAAIDTLRNRLETLAPREALQAAGREVDARFLASESAVSLVRLRAALVDELLRVVATRRLGPLLDEVALIAVGGYGRGELHPYSDIDLMLLLPEVLPADADTALSGFVTDLWDLGLEIGHSVRTVDDCAREAANDLTVATTLMEARLVCGPGALFAAMQEVTGPAEVWPSQRFFEAKRGEQLERHHRYDDTGYKLEPNVKGSPGGLRDIQLVGWVAKRHFGVETLAELVDHRFLTPGQLHLLEDGQAFLWRVRYALHLVAGRKEDRLLFDHQTRIAAMLGYEDATYTLAVEQLMQRYYRTVMDLSRLNEMLLQLFEEAILLDPDAAPVSLNARFQVKNDYLQTTHDQVFADEPSALLEVFLLLQQNPAIRGVSAVTVGLIKRNLHRIDEQFRQDPRNQRLFLQILRAPKGVTHELRRMNRYGVLGLYIPAFGRIVGRMQYDLFHAYTVDEHTLFVVSNLRRFALTRFDHEYPHCSRIMQSLDKPEVAYLSGLFHDIAKGRGGDHSELGAVDAEAFCLEHGMSRSDASTVAWLVRHHLALSTTAQKKDIGDPDVINEFASLVGDQAHLDYLYILTVADVRGTNPKLWNSWKASLFRDLYELTSSALRRGLENPLDREQRIADTQAEARELLATDGVDPASIERVWELFDGSYFLRHKPAEIAWHTAWLGTVDSDTAIGFVDLRRQADIDGSDDGTGADSGGVSGLTASLYTPRHMRTFAHATGALDELGMNIVDARIVPLRNGYSLDTFVFIEQDRRTEIDAARLRKIRASLAAVLEADDDSVRRVTRPVSRRQRMFSTPTRVTFSPATVRGHTVMELVAADRPGLLSRVGQTFIELGIDIETAKIMTIGERAEDVFYISDEHGNALTPEHCERLETELVRKLGEL